MITWTKEEAALLEKIDAEIENNAQDLVADTIRLVNIKSVEGKPLPGAPFGEGPRAVLDEAIRMGKAEGMDCVDYGCGVISMAKEAKEPDLGIWIHGDVVPEGDGWNFAPYDAVEYKGCVVGRGATDNKGQFAGVYNLFKIFNRLGIKLSYNPAIYVGSNEETGMKDIVGREGDAEAKGFLNVAKPPKMSLVPDSGFPVGYGGKGGCTLALVCDKPLTSFRLIAGQNDAPGFARAYFDRTDLPALPEDCKVTVENGVTTVETFSPPVHGAKPDPNGNMITMISEALIDADLCTAEEREILSFFAELSKDIHGECLGVKTHHEILGDLTVFSKSICEENGCPALHINIRYPMGITFDEIVARIGTEAKKRGFSLRVVARSVDPYLLDKDCFEVKMLCALSNEVTGEDKAPFTISGGTYAHRLPNAYVFGANGCLPPEDFPKGRGGAHGVDEVVSIARIQRMMKIYARTLLKLNGYFN